MAKNNPVNPEELTAVENAAVDNAAADNAAAEELKAKEQELLDREAALLAKEAEIEKLQAELNAKADKKTKNSKVKYVKITVPRATIDDKSDCVVGVNGVMYNIPKGIPQEVPDFVAEEINRGLNAIFESEKATKDLLAQQNINEIM